MKCQINGDRELKGGPGLFQGVQGSLCAGPRSARGRLTSPTPTPQRRTAIPSTHSRAPPPPVTFLRTNLSPPGCRPPLLLSCCRRRSDATRAGAPTAAALALARPSVRPQGCALHTLASTTHLLHSPFFTPLLPLFPSLLTLQPPEA